MTTTAKLYYLAAALAFGAALISIVDDGLNEEEYFHVGFLLVMTAWLVWMGSRQKSKPAD